MIEYELTEGIGKITLNRPEKYNAFIRKMALDLQAALEKCDKDNNVRAVLLTAKGKAFCAGQDLSEFKNPADINFELVIEEHYNPVIQKIRKLKKPVISAVNGIAAGAGASIALCCDIIIASEKASFVQAFCKIGLIPDSAGTFFLPRLIGMQRASSLMMTGDPISAKEAMRIGMIYKVYEDEKFIEESWNLAVKLSKMPTKGLSLTKELLNVSYQNNLEAQLELEKQKQVIAGKTIDFEEGVSSFLEKRKPNFKGK